jgi:hypothetical protein
MTTVNPNERATVDSVLEDPFLDDARAPAKKAAAAHPAWAEADLEVELW